MPTVVQPSTSYWNTTPTSNDPWASAKAAAAGAAKSAASSSMAATAYGTNNQQAQASAMGASSGQAGMGASSMSYDDMMRAIAASSHGGMNASSAAAGVAGQATQSANAGAMAAASKTMGDMYGSMPTPPQQAPAYNPAPTDIPYATWDNIQPYFNPMYQFMVDSGTNAIQNSAAAHNMLHSSGTVQDIGDWATKSAGQAYDSAVQKFMDDRSGVYGIGSDLRNFDYSNYQYQNQQGLDAYNSNKSDYQTQLADFYKQMKDLSSTGQGAAGKAGDLSTSSATAMANLFMAMAQMQSMGGMGQANNQSSFFGSLISMIPLLSGLV